MIFACIKPPTISSFFIQKCLHFRHTINKEENVNPRDDNQFHTFPEENAEYVVIDKDEFDAFLMKLDNAHSELESLFKSDEVDIAKQKGEEELSGFKSKLESLIMERGRIEMKSDYYVGLRVAILAHKEIRNNNKEE